MSIPKKVTREQIVEAFAVLGIDANQVMAISGDACRRELIVDLKPTDDEPMIFRKAVIPIVYGQEATP